MIKGRRESLPGDFTCVIAILLSLLLTGSSIAEAPSSIREISSSQSVQNQYAVLKYLAPALKVAGKPARIYFGANCNPHRHNLLWNDSLPFPSVRVQPPSNNKTGMAAIRDIFSGARNVKISEDHDVIRIRIDDPHDAILGTQINHLIVDKDAQYTEISVISRITYSKDVMAAAKRMGIHQINSGSISTLSQMPMPTLPHISSVTGMTMDEALDKVAKTFGVTVFYGSCSQAPLYDVYSFDTSTLDEWYQWNVQPLPGPK